VDPSAVEEANNCSDSQLAALYGYRN